MPPAFVPPHYIYASSIVDNHTYLPYIQEYVWEPHMPCKFIYISSQCVSCAIGMRNTWKEKTGSDKYDVLKGSNIIIGSVCSTSSPKGGANMFVHMEPGMMEGEEPGYCLGP